MQIPDLNVIDVLVAPYRASVRPAIPEIIGFLVDTDKDVRKMGVDALAKLSEQGEVSNFPTCLLLMYL